MNNSPQNKFGGIQFTRLKKNRIKSILWPNAQDYLNHKTQSYSWVQWFSAMDVQVIIYVPKCTIQAINIEAIYLSVHEWIAK